VIVDGIESRRWRCVERDLFEILDDGQAWAPPHAATMYYGSRSSLSVGQRIHECESAFFALARELHR
jgi:hypothetical protein